MTRIGATTRSQVTVNTMFEELDLQKTNLRKFVVVPQPDPVRFSGSREWEVLSESSESEIESSSGYDSGSEIESSSESEAIACINDSEVESTPSPLVRADAVPYDILAAFVNNENLDTTGAGNPSKVEELAVESPFADAPASTNIEKIETNPSVNIEKAAQRKCCSLVSSLWRLIFQRV